jgi:hypothetical protein
MAQQSSRSTAASVKVSVVLDSGFFLTDAAAKHENYAEVGYFLPHIVVYGDGAEIHSMDLTDAHSESRMIRIRHFDSNKRENTSGVDYGDDLLKTLLRREELYGKQGPEFIPSRFDWIFRFDSGQFRASSVKERIFKQCEGYTNQPNGNRKLIRPIAHDVVVHYDLGPEEYLTLSNDGIKEWSTEAYPKVVGRFDIEIVAPHRTAENYFRDALNHNGQDYWLPNQGDPDPMARP